jgi:hypothetical protein
MRVRTSEPAWGLSSRRGWRRAIRETQRRAERNERPSAANVERSTDKPAKPGKDE